MADTETVAPPAQGPLTLEQAVTLQLEKKRAAQQETAPEAETATIAEQPEGEAAAGTETPESEAGPQPAEGAEGEAEKPSPEGDEAGEAEPEEAIEPPEFWDAEGKESFAKLPKTAQKAVREYEKQRSKAVDKAMRESAIARKGFEAKQAQLQATSDEIGEFVSEGEARKQQWAEWFRSPDAEKLKAEDPGEFVRQQDIYRQEMFALEQAKDKKAKIDAKQFAIFKAEQEALLPTLIPEFAGQHADKHRSDLAKYLSGYAEGKAFDRERLNGLSAYEAQVAWKAMRFDELEKRFAEAGGLEAQFTQAAKYRNAEAIAKKPPPLKPKVPAGPSAGAAGQGQGTSSDETRLKQLNGLKRSWTSDEHVEVMMLKAKLGK